MKIDKGNKSRGPMEINKTYQKGKDTYTLYKMRSAFGMSVSVMTLGAGIHEILWTKDDGEEYPLTLSFENIADYENLCCYAGATIGPNSGRIQGGELEINGRIFALSKNEGCNQLHGGFDCLAAHNWTVSAVGCDGSAAFVRFQTSQKDGVDGFPGNRDYKVTYTFEDTNRITIDYRATTDADTYINMTNHTYWNLGYRMEKIYDHALQVLSNHVCINNEEDIPVNIIPTANTIYDFGKSSRISERNVNNAFILNHTNDSKSARSVKQPEALKKAAVLSHKETGRRLEVMTDAPALVVYTGEFLPKNKALTDNRLSSASCAVALEAQDIPNAAKLMPQRFLLTTGKNMFVKTIQYHIT